VCETTDIRSLLELGIREEHLGGVFYRRLADRFAGERLGAVFADLADQEQTHERRFRAMLDDLESAQDRSGPARDVRERPTPLLADEDDARRQADQAPSPDQAIDLANRLEREALMILHQLSGGARADHQPIVAELIAEEQAHLQTLADARAHGEPTS
jgi:rubrerythrin